MNVKELETLYRDAISVHLKGMGFNDFIADFEATRILKRWIGER